MKSFFRRFLRDSPPAADAGPDGHVDDLLRRGNEAEDAGNLAAACELYRQAVAQSPRSADAHFNLGNALAGMGRGAEALPSYRRAIELRPDHMAAHLNLGATQLRCGAPDGAEKSYRAAIELNPESAGAWTGLGCALDMRADPAGAAAAFERALELDAGSEGAASRLALLLRASGRAYAALELLQSALRAHPDSEILQRTQAEMAGNVGEYAVAVAAYRRLQEIAPGNLPDFSNLLWTLNFMPEAGASEILHEHRRFGADLGGRVARLPPRLAVPGRRLRVGYLSPDFRRHSVACFIEPLLRAHDRNRFEIHCFYTYPGWDDVTARINKLCERWHDVSNLSDDDIARGIAEAGIDILVDLAGHSAHNRLRVLAAKPAPVQFTWLGYLCTTGVSAVDYRLCDAHTDPEGIAEGWQVETPARLPDSQWCYQPQVEIPEPSPLPMLRNGYCTFGSFNQESKLNAPALDAWADVLAAVPGSRLRVLGVSCDIVEDRIRLCLEAKGIEPERLDVVGRVPIDAYFQQYREVDVALDSFPYNGATTTCDALLMGVPVATIAGERAIARGGVSILSTVGLQDWIAESPAALPGMLRAHAADPARLAQLRATLPARTRTSALMDASRFARNVEAVFEGAWNRSTAAGGQGG